MFSAALRPFERVSGLCLAFARLWDMVAERCGPVARVRSERETGMIPIHAWPA